MTPYEQIKEDIILGKLKPGSVFNEKQYVEKLSTSRTPIREAVLKLADEGYIRILPRKGTIVTDISLKEIKSLYEYRMLIEPNIFGLYKHPIPNEWIDGWIEKFSEILNHPEYESKDISKDDDKDFHVGLVSFTNNDYIIREEEKIMDKCLRIHILSNMESNERYLSSIQEHLEILWSLKEGNMDKCAELMKNHLSKTIHGFAFIGE